MIKTFTASIVLVLMTTPAFSQEFSETTVPESSPGSTPVYEWGKSGGQIFWAYETLDKPAQVRVEFGVDRNNEGKFVVFKDCFGATVENENRTMRVYYVGPKHTLDIDCAGRSASIDSDFSTDMLYGELLEYRLWDSMPYFVQEAAATAG